MRAQIVCPEDTVMGPVQEGDTRNGQDKAGKGERT
jgi:hypothetical protein